MSPNKVFFTLLVVFITFALSCAPAKSDSSQAPVISLAKTDDESKLPFEQGETIFYTIKNLGVKAGSATLEFYGLTKLNNQDAYLIVFTASALNFFDQEKIYADPKTFYPIFVQRDLNLWGKKEKIDEYYDQGKRTLTLVKTVAGQKSEQVIQAKSGVDNIYCFIYRHRISGSFAVGDSFVMFLPTADVKIALAKMTKLKAAGQIYDAYYMRSDPPKYELWFDKSPQKIPLKINGSLGPSIGFSLLTMTMSDYQARGEKETKN